VFIKFTAHHNHLVIKFLITQNISLVSLSRKENLSSQAMELILLKLMMWVEVVSDRLRQGELGPGGQVDEGLVHSGGDEGLFSRKFCGGKA
jgi:hypothetical protein